MILGITEAPQTISFGAMRDRQRAVARAVLEDPAVESLSSFIGVDGINTTLNSGRIQINLKPFKERKLSASDIVQRLQSQVAAVGGITLFAAGAGPHGRESREPHAIPIHAEDADPEELNRWAPALVESLQALPSCAT